MLYLSMDLFNHALPMWILRYLWIRLTRSRIWDAWNEKWLRPARRRRRPSCRVRRRSECPNAPRRRRATAEGFRRCNRRSFETGGPLFFEGNLMILKCRKMSFSHISIWQDYYKILFIFQQKRKSKRFFDWSLIPVWLDVGVKSSPISPKS